MQKEVQRFQLNYFLLRKDFLKQKGLKKYLRAFFLQQIALKSVRLNTKCVKLDSKRNKMDC
jgi:hypothetical protein